MGRSKKNERLLAIRDQLLLGRFADRELVELLISLIDALLPRSKPTLAEASKILAERRTINTKPAAKPAPVK